MAEQIIIQSMSRGATAVGRQLALEPQPLGFHPYDDQPVSGSLHFPLQLNQHSGLLSLAAYLQIKDVAKALCHFAKFRVTCLNSPKKRSIQVSVGVGRGSRLGVGVCVCVRARACMCLCLIIFAPLLLMN